MPKPVAYKFRLVYFLVFVVAFLIGFPILVFYSAGYTIDDAFNLSVRGGIYVFIPEPDTSVFIGNELKSVSSFFNKEILVSGLKPDQYLVLATNDVYWPWAKIVNVTRGEVAPLYPLLVPKVVEATEIETTGTDRKSLLALFATTTPTSIKTVKATTTAPIPEILTRKNVDIWLMGNNVYAEWQGSTDAAPRYFCALNICTDPVLVFESSLPIRSFDFYPYRDDAIILALDNGIYAVEIDHRQYQNFYPIFRGQAPDFRVNKNQVYIKDNNYLAELNLNP